MNQDNLMEIWERIRDILRKLRGENLWRGTELHLLPRKQLRLQAENRGSKETGKEVLIHLSDAEVEIWAELRPGGEQLYLKDFGHDMERYLLHITGICRGKAYLHTNSKVATYRKQLLEEGK
jgi:hypothetical protein